MGTRRQRETPVVSIKTCSNTAISCASINYMFEASHAIMMASDELPHRSILDLERQFL